MNRAPSSAAAPRRRRPRTALSLSLAGLLLATACGAGESSDGSSSPASASSSAAAQGSEAASSSAAPVEYGDPAALDGLTFTVGADGTPSATVGKAIESDKAVVKTLTKGSGATPKAGDVLRLSTALLDPATGKVLNENFTTQPEMVAVGSDPASMNPYVHKAVYGAPVGSDVAVYLPAPSSSASAPSGTEAAPAQLAVFRVQGVAEQLPQADERLPKVSVDPATGRPSIEKPTGSAPEELVVEPLIQGEGPEVEDTDTVAVQYQGVTWSDGSTFDSSYERGTPATFSLDQVIAGWKEGLAGQKVGSRVLISVPSEKAYGAEGTPDGSIGKDEDLLFVVDILAAQPAAASSPAAPSGSTAPSGSSSASPSN